MLLFKYKFLFLSWLSPQVLKWQGIYGYTRFVKKYACIATYSIKRQELISELHTESDCCAFQMRLCRGPRDTSFKTQYLLFREPFGSGQTRFAPQQTIPIKSGERGIGRAREQRGAAQRANRQRDKIDYREHRGWIRRQNRSKYRGARGFSFYLSTLPHARVPY